MSSPNYIRSDRRRPLVVLVAVVSLISTAVLIGLVASGELLGGEGTSVITPAHSGERTLIDEGRSAFDAYPEVGYAPNLGEAAAGTFDPYPSPAPTQFGTIVLANENEANSLADQPQISEPTVLGAIAPLSVGEEPNSGESLKIASPSGEAELCSAFAVKGSASGLIPGQLAMILLQSAEGGRIYPQGPIIPDENGDWHVNIVGLPLGEQFALTPALPHGESLRRLNEYLEVGRSTGVWAGVDSIGQGANTFTGVSIRIAPTPCPGIENSSPADDTEYNGYKVIGS